jgi:hypothetical protein
LTHKKTKKRSTKLPNIPFSTTEGTRGSTSAPDNPKSSNRKSGSQSNPNTINNKPSALSLPAATLPNRKRKHPTPSPEVEQNGTDSDNIVQAATKRKKSGSAPGAAEVAAPLSSSANQTLATNDAALVRKPTRYRRGQAAPITQSTSVAQGAAKGKYTEQEFQLLDSAISGFQNTHSLSREDLAKLISGQPNESDDTQARAKGLWDAVSDALPHRPRQSLQKCARRRYHTGRRGKFTKEEDEAIIESHELYKNHKDVWVKVGQAVNRSAPDVRDRYRNNLIRPDKQRKDVWDGEEEALFINLFESQLETARKAHEEKVAKGRANGPFDEQNFYPNMEIIEKEMDYTRGNLQLRNKFHKIMKRREQNRKPTAKDPSKKSGRVETAESHFKKKMRPGDKYGCLKDILAGMIRYKHKTEDRIPWSEIQQDYKASGGQEWGTPERKVVYERTKVLAGTNPNDSVAEILKAEILYMEKTYTQEELAQHFDGKRRKGQRKNPSKGEVKKSKNKKASKVISKSYVSDSSEESQSDTAPNPPTSDSESSKKSYSDTQARLQPKVKAKKMIKKPSFKSSARVHDDDSDEQVDSDVSMPSVGQKLLTSSASDAPNSGASASKLRISPKLRNKSSSSESSSSSSSESEQNSNVQIKTTSTVTKPRSKLASGRPPRRTSSSGKSSSSSENDDRSNNESVALSLVTAARSIATSKLPKAESTSESSTESEDSSDEE